MILILIVKIAHSMIVGLETRRRLFGELETRYVVVVVVVVWS